MRTANASAGVVSSRPRDDFRPATTSAAKRVDAPVPAEAYTAEIDWNNPQPSQRPGMGANVYPGGVSFRAWFPNATQVWVAGDFNGWQPTKLANEFNGNWSIDYPGASAGQQYKFRVDDWNQTQWRVDPRARRVTNSTGNGIIVDPGNFQWWHDQDFHAAPQNQAVVYEMHVGSFQTFYGGEGNWQSAINKLDYLQSLGITHVEVMPVMEFPGDESWGYNPANPYAPESSYGKASPNDDPTLGFRQFVDEAHRRGIGVVVDVVWNHLGPNDLDTAMNDNIGPQNLYHGGEYFYPDQRAHTPWGWTRPDYGRQEVRDFIADQIHMLFNEYHVDGVRADATYAIRENDTGTDPNGWEVMRRITDVVHSQPSPKLAIAEDGANLDAITDGNGAGFNAQWGIDDSRAIRAAITAGNDAGVDVQALANAIGRYYNGSASNRVLFTESHDMDANGSARVPSLVGGWDAGGYFAQKKATQGAAIVLTAPGLPMLFMGQEFLQPGNFDAGNPGAWPLNWNLAGDFSGIVQLHRDLIHLHRNWNNNTQGLSGNGYQPIQVNNDTKVLAYHRWDQGGAGDDTVVIHNLSGNTYQNYTVGLPDTGTWRVRFNSDSKVYSPSFGDTQTFDVGGRPGSYDGMPANGSLTIGPHTTVILSKDRGT